MHSGCLQLALQEICRRGRTVGPSRVDRREVLLVYVDHHVRRFNSSTWNSYGAHVDQLQQGEVKRDQPGAFATGGQGKGGSFDASSLFSIVKPMGRYLAEEGHLRWLTSKAIMQIHPQFFFVHLQDFTTLSSAEETDV